MAYSSKAERQTLILILFFFMLYSSSRIYATLEISVDSLKKQNHGPRKLSRHVSVRFNAHLPSCPPTLFLFFPFRVVLLLRARESHNRKYEFESRKRFEYADAQYASEYFDARFPGIVATTRKSSLRGLRCSLSLLGILQHFFALFSTRPTFPLFHSSTCRPCFHLSLNC